MPAERFDQVLPLVEKAYSHCKTESKQNGDFTVSEWVSERISKGKRPLPVFEDDSLTRHCLFA